MPLPDGVGQRVTRPARYTDSLIQAPKGQSAQETTAGLESRRQAAVMTSRAGACVVRMWAESFDWRLVA